MAIWHESRLRTSWLLFRPFSLIAWVSDFFQKCLFMRSPRIRRFAAALVVVSFLLIAFFTWLETDRM